MAIKIPLTITELELQRIINDKIVKKNKKRILAYLLGFYNCLRVSEVIKLKPEDFTDNDKLLHIRQAKGEKDRNIPVAPEVKNFLKYLPIKVGIRALEKSINHDSERSIGKKIHFHTLRHSGATYYLNEKRWDIRQVQVFLGHSRIDTTQIYTHVNPKDLTKIMWGE